MTEQVSSKVNGDLIIYRLDEIKSELADFKKHYVTKEESQALKQEIGELRIEIQDIKKRNSLLGWLYPTLSAGFSAVFVYLILEYIKSKH